MTFQRERISDVWEEALPMLTANHAETGILTPEDFRPSKARYEALEATGFMCIYTARNGGQLVGYATFFIVPHLQYAGIRWAQQDAMYIKPEFRGFTGAKFIQFTDAQLKQEGADCVYRDVIPQLDYSRTLERMGYSHIQSGFMRRL